MYKINSFMSLRWLIGQTLGKHYHLFKLVYTLKNRNSSLLINNKTELVIEGYPRSANSFAILAFQSIQPTKIKIAHHVHIPAQIIQASKLGTPAMVLIREPLQAIKSMLVREPKLDPLLAIQMYVSFYETLIPFSSDFIVADFDRITTSYSEIIKALNSKFNTSFNINVEQDIDSHMEKLSWINKNGGKSDKAVSAPTAEKNFAKNALDLSMYNAEMARARKVYELFLNL